MSTVYVVEDDEEFRAELVDFLQKYGFSVSSFGTIGDFRNLIATGRIVSDDVVLLDLTLNAEYVLADIVSIVSSGAGCIVLTGSPSETDRILGLELGADDYIQKGSSLREIVARIRAVKRRGAPKTQNGQNGQQTSRNPDHSIWTIDVMRACVNSPDGATSHLTSAELAVLILLIDANGGVVSRDTLSQRAFNRPHHYGDRSLDNVVTRVRLKLMSLGADRSSLRSVRNQGYIFAGLPGRYQLLNESASREEDEPPTHVELFLSKQFRNGDRAEHPGPDKNVFSPTAGKKSD